MAVNSWNDLSEGQRKGIVSLGVIEAMLTLFALRDLRKRPSSGVRGPKLLWLGACVIQPFGPIAYLLLGRRRGDA